MINRKTFNIILLFLEFCNSISGILWQVFSDTSGVIPQKTGKAKQIDKEIWGKKPEKEPIDNTVGIYSNAPERPLKSAQKFYDDAKKIGSTKVTTQQDEMPSSAKAESKQTEDIVIIDDENDDTKPSPTHRLTGTNWFSSTDINTAQSLLKIKYPTIGGLYDTDFLSGVSVEPLPAEFNSGPPTSKFVQIINVGAHWVTISNLNSGPDEVMLYDSLNYGINEEAQRTITYMAKNFIRGPVLTIVRKGVQQQQGYDDCGPMAIAFAHSLCSGNDPSGCQYEQGSLRDAIIRSFRNEEVNIPITGVKVRKDYGMVKVKVWCDCKLNWIKTPRRENEDMASCDGCVRWYHRYCQRIPDKVLQYGSDWICSHYFCLKYYININ